jgi:RNA recognition motif-containing protein
VWLCVSGEVLSAQIVYDRKTKRNRGFGFVQMARAADASQAIRQWNGTVQHLLGGKECSVKLGR